VNTPSRAVVLFLAIAFGWLCAAGLGAAQDPPAPSSAGARPPATLLRLGSRRWPPLTDGEGHPHIALDLVDSVLERAGYKASTQIVPDGTLSRALREGRFDGSAALWVAPDRREFLLFSRAYFENRLVLVGMATSPVDATSLDALHGKRLGIVKDYPYGEGLERHKGVKLVPGANSEENVRALLHGQVDYVLIDDLEIHHLLARYPKELEGRIAVGRTPLVRRSLHLGIRKQRPDAQAIIDAFDRALDSILRDGTYNELIGVDWIRTDLDGDGRPDLVASDAHVGTEPPRDFYDVLATTHPAKSSLHDTAIEPRFVVKGVAYDTWTAVPDEYRTKTDDLGAKPRTLRAEVFQF
jgi:polar amino acid transport system substrate-binding protein